MTKDAISEGDIAPNPPICIGDVGARHVERETRRKRVAGEPRWVCPRCSKTLPTWEAG